MTISVVGLGKLGLPLACIFSFYGYEVIGIDYNKNLINKLYAGKLVNKEKELISLFRHTKKHIAFTQNYDIIGDITFIVVPTPSVNNKFSSAYIEEALDKIKTKQKVVIVSTVMPGETDRLQLKYPHLQLVYNPAFIALGSIVRDFTDPDFILIGSKFPRVTTLLKNIYTRVCSAKKPCAILSPLEAEVAKLSLNCYLTTKITFANQIGNLAYRLGVSGKKICQAIGMDSRIGNKYFTPGLGYGGPCLPRDNKALNEVMLENDVLNNCERTDDLNNQQVFELLQRIIKLKPKTIGFKSLSYKQGTDSTENSQLAQLYDALKYRGWKVKIGKGKINLDWRGIV